MNPIRKSGVFLFKKIKIMAKEKSKVKILKKLNDQLKSHSDNPKMVGKLKQRILTVEGQKFL
jgi:hypothetical protein